MKIRVISIILILLIVFPAISGCGDLNEVLKSIESGLASPDNQTEQQEQSLQPDGEPQPELPEPINDETDEPVSEAEPNPTEPPAEPPTEPPTEPKPESMLAWKVEPKYAEIMNIWWAGKIVYDGLILDLYTGEVSVWDGNDYPTGGIPSPIEWLYDESNNLFGLYGTTEEYAPNEFKIFTESGFAAYLDEIYWWDTPGSMINHLREFRKVDSSKVVQKESYYDEWEEKYYYEYDMSGAYIGDKFAIAYGTKFLTDFIYDHDNNARTNSPTADFIATKSGGKWGVIDKTGNIAVPFILDDIIFSSNDSAFALYEGKYGILEIK